MSERLYDLCLRYQDRGNVTNGFQEVSWLVSHMLGCSNAQIHTMTISDFPEIKQKKLSQALSQYSSGVPLGYILGSVWFYDLEVIVRPGVLIPRQDTECLVDEVLKRVNRGDKILELGVGSGAVSCAIAAHTKDLNVQIMAVDKSDIAISVTQENLKRHNITDKVALLEADWFDLKLTDPVDIIVSNPPYITPSDTRVSDQVRQYEPKEALFAKDQGLSDIKQILTVGQRLLNKGGHLVIEHGDLQQEEVIKLFGDFGYTQVESNEYNGLPRYICGRRQ
ncbi:MAG: peptide chain release factor N(5)-glutamine methyltransferase [Pseudomonadota bacterium]|nr:peptide chain release factor N(5)-glutamine methyltransferase [Pseudomonadota bacterium]